MVFDSAHPNPQRLADFLVGQALGQQTPDGLFPRGQVVVHPVPAVRRHFLIPVVLHRQMCGDDGGAATRPWLLSGAPSMGATLWEMVHRLSLW